MALKEQVQQKCLGMALQNSFLEKADKVAPIQASQTLNPELWLARLGFKVLKTGSTYVSNTWRKWKLGFLPR